MPDRCTNCNVQSAYNWLHHSRLMLIVCVWYMYLCGGGDKLYDKAVQTIF